jgi:hypothetical protein
VRQVAPAWYERFGGVVALATLNVLLLWATLAIDSNVAESSFLHFLGVRLGLLAFFVMPPLLLLSISRAARRRQLMRRDSLLPLTVISAVSGQSPTGAHVARSAGLLGRLTINADGLEWRSLAPWRRPRSIEVPWRDVRAIRGWNVDAAGWRNLMLGPSHGRYVRAAIEECGMVWHRHPWDRQAPDVALWAEEQPDWDVVSRGNRVDHGHCPPTPATGRRSPPASRGPGLRCKAPGLRLGVGSRSERRHLATSR